MSIKVQDVPLSNKGYDINGKELLLHDPEKYGTDDTNSSVRITMEQILLNRRIFSEEPEGGWKEGDLWFFTADNAAYPNQLRLITGADGVEDDLVFSILATLSDGTSLSSINAAQCSIQSGNQGLGTVWVIATAKEFDINNSFVFGYDKIEYNSAEVSSLNLFPKIYESVSNPVDDDIPEGFYKIFKNTVTGALKLFANDAGVFKALTFTAEDYTPDYTTGETDTEKKFYDGSTPHTIYSRKLEVAWPGETVVNGDTRQASGLSATRILKIDGFVEFQETVGGSLPLRYPLNAGNVSAKASVVSNKYELKIYFDNIIDVGSLLPAADHASLGKLHAIVEYTKD